MATPILDEIRKQAGLGRSISTGLRYLSKNPRSGAAALGALGGGTVGMLSGGDLKSTLLGAGLGAGGGYALGRYGMLDPSRFWTGARAKHLNMRRAIRQAMAGR